MGSKERILEKNGYKHDTNRDIFYNYNTKKIFSREVIADHDENWILNKIKEDNNDWSIYSNSMTEETKKAIISELEKKYCKK